MGYNGFLESLDIKHGKPIGITGVMPLSHMPMLKYVGVFMVGMALVLVVI